jgi:hypothetical protein
MNAVPGNALSLESAYHSARDKSNAEGGDSRQSIGEDDGRGKDYEALSETSETLIYAAMSYLRLRRLAQG